MSLPFSQACENNKHPILDILKRVLINHRHVFEIGSGTGQHAVHFAAGLPSLSWHCSDVPANLGEIRQWCIMHPSENLIGPTEFDLRHPLWPGGFDAVFSANTAHIMPWPLVQRMIREAARHLPDQGLLILYGPFNYHGHYTSDSNAQFDTWLKSRDPDQGIRDFEAVDQHAQDAGLQLVEDNAMPANNRLLVWQKNLTDD